MITVPLHFVRVIPCATYFVANQLEALSLPGSIHILHLDNTVS